MYRSIQGESSILSAAELEGKEALESDSRTGEIRPNEVFCTSCNTWIALDPVTPYATANWEAHLLQCAGSM
jgi:hypothetical protein